MREDVISRESISIAEAMEQLMFDYSNLESVYHLCYFNIYQKKFGHFKEAVQANNKRAMERFADKFLYSV